jgi:general secretion pathway protein E
MEVTQLAPVTLDQSAEPLRLGEILLRTARLTESALEEALTQQREKGGRIGEVLMRLKFVTADDVAKALAAQAGAPFVATVKDIEPRPDLAKAIPINFAKKFELVPVSEDDDGVVVVASDPYQITAVDDVAALLGKPVRVAVSSSQNVLELINRFYDRTSDTVGLVDDLNESDLDSVAHELEGEEVEDLLDVTDEAPIIKLINSLIFQAVKDRASDIHIEPGEREIAVRFRVDGVLRNVIRPPKRFQSSIISRVKIMAGLNIAEKRLPQDGRIRTKIAGKDIDIRVSTLPTSFGERVVMRLLDRSAVLLDLEDVGIPDQTLERINKIINLSHGIFLVTGPTGSGKTTTLYGCLSAINSEDINIITVEDPVEYQLKGISQIQVQSKINLTFASALRSILRQDPDVVLIGEMRDLETAEIAIQASLTGHLVFSTLHTNDSAGAVTRLTDMGVEPFLVASSVVGIMAQRLVRTICPHCKESYTPTKEELAELGIKPEQLVNGVVYRGAGCSECMTSGYKGRSGIYELMLVSDKVRQLILKNTDSNTIKRQAVSEGMRTLRDDGADKVIAGLTTIEEVLRVTQEDTIE